MDDHFDKLSAAPQATNQAGWFTRTYQYSATIPHAVTSVTSEQSTVDSYEYDLNGNMTCRIENGVTYSQAYNAENRISSIAKRTGDCATGTILESWSFAYDGDGVRVMTAHFTGSSGTPDSTTSYYMGGQYEVKDSAVKKYYSIAGMMVAVNDGTGLQYLLTDHLGSTVAVTNSSGTLTSQQRYLPFGEERAIPNSPILGTDFTFTGQRKLDDGMGGIMDYKARFYSPALGRFQQPDSIIPNLVNPQAYDRYSYVTNRPILFNDPIGHDQDCGPDNIYCGGLSDSYGSTSPTPPSYPPDDLDDGLKQKKPKKKNQETCEQTRVYSSLCPGWHYYTTTKVVCPAIFQCTEDEMKDYMLRFAYPNQDPSQSAVDQNRYTVGIPIVGLDLREMGAIDFETSNGGLTTTNITRRPHIIRSYAVAKRI